MQKLAIYTLLSFMALFVFTGLTQAQTSTSTTSELQTLIQQLQEQLKTLQEKQAALKAQEDALKATRENVKDARQDIKGTLKLIRQLRKGMTGEDVKLLQELLATDPEIYPEGLITGFFGLLTENAVKRFQKKAGFEQVGNVGPKTFARLNELLTEGAGNSSKVPPGLLIAPGIKKKIEGQFGPLPGQTLPPGIMKKLDGASTTPDTTAPAISEIHATSTTSTGTTIAWKTDEKANSAVWYGNTTPLDPDTSSKVSSGAFIKMHETAITGLSASTTYYYIVGSADESDNHATSTEQSFNTLP